MDTVWRVPRIDEPGGVPRMSRGMPSRRPRVGGPPAVLLGYGMGLNHCVGDEEVQRRNGSDETQFDTREIQGWSAAGRKKPVVLRLLGGECQDALSREMAVSFIGWGEWRERALAGIDAGLKAPDSDPFERSIECGYPSWPQAAPPSMRRGRISLPCEAEGRSASTNRPMFSLLAQPRSVRRT